MKTLRQSMVSLPHKKGKAYWPHVIWKWFFYHLLSTSLCHRVTCLQFDVVRLTLRNCKFVNCQINISVDTSILCALRTQKANKNLHPWHISVSPRSWPFDWGFPCKFSGSPNYQETIRTIRTIDAQLTPLCRASQELQFWRLLPKNKCLTGALTEPLTTLDAVPMSYMKSGVGMQGCSWSVRTSASCVKAQWWPPFPILQRWSVSFGSFSASKCFSLFSCPGLAPTLRLVDRHC